ncbi:MAG: OadG family protein, partial [Treponema sp.]|nr:OadG family protein [Treponema sp.]
MTIADMLGQSGILTLLGMGVVFGFLIILVVAVTLVGKIIHALGADRDIAAPAAGGSSGGGAVKTTAVAAAITAALVEYR